MKEKTLEDFKNEVIIEQSDNFIKWNDWDHFIRSCCSPSSMDKVLSIAAQRYANHVKAIALQEMYKQVKNCLIEFSIEAGSTDGSIDVSSPASAIRWIENKMKSIEDSILHAPDAVNPFKPANNEHL